MKYLIGFLLVIIASYADIFLYRIGIAPAEPSKFFIPLLLVLCAIRYSKLRILDLLKSHSFLFLLGIFLISILYAVFSPADRETINRDIFLNLITLLLYIFSVEFFRTESRKLVLMVLLFSFLSIALSVVYDFLIGLPRTNQKLIDAVRKGGFGENPNQAASAIKFLAFGTLVFFQNNKKYRLLIILPMILAIFLTMSRSGIISAVLIIILGTSNSWQKNFQLTIPNLLKNSFKMVFLFATLFITLVLLSDVIKQNFPAFTRGAAGERLDLLTGKSKKGIISEDVGSGGGRGDLLFKYFDEFKTKPLGYGTGYTATRKFNKLNTHNYYLFLAVNYGIIALIMYLIYLSFGMSLSINENQFYYLIFIILIVFEGLISHSIFFERALLISLAFFDSLIYKRENRILDKQMP